VSDVPFFGWVIGLVGVGVTLAVLSNRFSERIRVPAPAIFLLVAAVASDLVPALGRVSVVTVQRVVTVALVVILFDGGMHMGWRRTRSAAGPILAVGVLGTFLTAGLLAVAAHALFGFGWLAALLIGTALAPTDPAVVFSVLGRREVVGRTGTILEGESGANDPVGIALMVALLGAGGSVAAGIGAFVVQMAVGAVVGVAGGLGLARFVRRVPLPSAGLYPLRVLAAAAATYGLATVAHGSGFLAVFVAGIVLGDARAPYKAETVRFHSSLASLGEIVAFTVLGATIPVRALGGAWLVGLALAVLLTLVVRPLAVFPLLLPVRLRMGERAFVVWAGLKGAVPILLGTFVLAAHVAGATRIYHVIFVVVAFSVLVQGGTVPVVARWCGVPMRVVEPEPWSSGMRFRHEPEGLRRFVVAPGSPADGVAVRDLTLDEEVWFSFVSRDGHLVQVTGDTVLAAGDEVLVQVDPERATEPAALFDADR
jgi:cell volume regulation protein A